MTRATTWTNSDGLVVGFGRNFAERQAGGVTKTFGAIKEARVRVTYESTFGTSGALISLPANSYIHKVWFVTDAAFTTSDAGTLTVGDTDGTDDVDGWITDLVASSLAGEVREGDGAYAVGNNADNAGNPQVRTTACDIYFTKTNNLTAGSGTLVVEYS